MDKNTLNYYGNILFEDCNSFMNASNPPEGVSDADFRRALNAELEALRADIANLQYLIDG